MKIVKIINHNFLYVDTGASAYFSLYLITFYQMFCVPKIYNSFKLLISKRIHQSPRINSPNKYYPCKINFLVTVRLDKTSDVCPMMHIQ